jgi:hypothetical protein
MIVIYLLMALLGSAATIFALQNRDPVKITFLAWAIDGMPEPGEPTDRRPAVRRAPIRGPAPPPAEPPAAARLSPSAWPRPPGSPTPSGICWSRDAESA